MFKKFIYILAGILILAGCRKNQSSSQRTSIDTSEIQFRKDGELRIVNEAGEELAGFEIEVAKSDYQQQTGLMYRKHMDKNRGMLFVYDDEQPRPYFYMKNTYIALDLIYISADKKVVDINKNAAPLNEKVLTSNAPAQYVLEVNAGTADEKGIKEGDSVEIDI